MNHPNPADANDTTTDTQAEDALRALAVTEDHQPDRGDAAAQADATPAPAADDAAPVAAAVADPAAAAEGGTAPVSPAAGEGNPELARLREELARQRAEITRLTQLTSLYSGSGHAGSPPAQARRFEDLSVREMEVELRRQARGLDGF